MNVTINIADFSEIPAKIDDVLSKQSVDNENYFEILAYNALITKNRNYTDYYINGAENIINRLNEVSGKNNEVSI